MVRVHAARGGYVIGNVLGAQLMCVPSQYVTLIKPS